jgi:hypothetical protein
MLFIPKDEGEIQLLSLLNPPTPSRGMHDSTSVITRSELPTVASDSCETEC